MGELVDILECDDNIGRRTKMERKLCQRLDQMIACQIKLEKFMNVNVNKDFVPSYIPSKTQQKTWLNSPPWKRKKMQTTKTKKIKKKKENDEDEKDKKKKKVAE